MYYCYLVDDVYVINFVNDFNEINYDCFNSFTLLWPSRKFF